LKNLNKSNGEESDEQVEAIFNICDAKHVDLWPRQRAEKERGRERERERERVLLFRPKSLRT